MRSCFRHYSCYSNFFTLTFIALGESRPFTRQSLVRGLPLTRASLNFFTLTFKRRADIIHPQGNTWCATSGLVLAGHERPKDLPRSFQRSDLHEANLTSCYRKFRSRSVELNCSLCLLFAEILKASVGLIIVGFSSFDVIL